MHGLLLSSVVLQSENKASLPREALSHVLLCSSPVSGLQLLVPFLGAWEILSEGFWLGSCALWVCPHWHLQSLLLSGSMSGAVGISAT